MEIKNFKGDLDKFYCEFVEPKVDTWKDPEYGGTNPDWSGVKWAFNYGVKLGKQIANKEKNNGN